VLAESGLGSPPFLLAGKRYFSVSKFNDEKMLKQFGEEGRKQMNFRTTPDFFLQGSDRA
jgi:hypothetical protein